MQPAGYHCAMKCAWAVTAIFMDEHREQQASLQQLPLSCRRSQGIVGILVLALNYAGVARELLAFSRRAFSNIHEAARNRAGISRELKASSRQHPHCFSHGRVVLGCCWEALDAMRGSDEAGSTALVDEHLQSFRHRSNNCGM